MYSKIETKFGNVWAIPTEANHIFVDFGTNLNVPKEGGEGFDRKGPLVVRGVTYTGSIHAYLWNDGTWHLGQENKDKWNQRHSFYMSRLGGDYCKSEPSEAARNAVLNEVLPKLNVWAENNSDLIKQAQKSHLEKERGNREEKIAELKNQIRQLELEIVDLLTQQVKEEIA